MSGRTPRLSRLRRVVPEGRSARQAIAARAGRPAEARGGRARRRGSKTKGGALGGGIGVFSLL
ncbi:hypothetical protein ACFCYR_22210, partial [Streptomyces sp. NPDC056291]